MKAVGLLGSLPSDVITHIQEYLDFHDVLQCSLVNKTWLRSSHDDFLWIVPLQTVSQQQSLNVGKKELRKLFIDHKKRIRREHFIQNTLRPRVRAISQWWIVCVLVMICFVATWFGIFFGITYVEMSAPPLRSLTVDCVVKTQTLQQQSCVDVKCDTCSLCNTNTSCYGTISVDYGQSMECCGGSYCCNRTCQTCTKCTCTTTSKGKCRETCTNYSCNCTCSPYLSQRSCTITNTTCYKSSVTCEMTVPLNTTWITLTKNISKSCSDTTNITCYSDFLASNAYGTNIPQLYYLSSSNYYKAPFSTKNIVLLSVFTSLTAFSVVIASILTFVAQVARYLDYKKPPASIV
jgi:hypothetical protein